MSQKADYIAVDLGAESGRVMLGRIADGRLTLEQIHRFANGPVEQAGTLRWDFDRLLSEIGLSDSEIAALREQGVVA